MLFLQSQLEMDTKEKHLWEQVIQVVPERLTKAREDNFMFELELSKTLENI
jgi:hypothetical protein